jgi:hypothetical protein
MEECQKRNDGGAKSKLSASANYLRCANRKTGQWPKKHGIARRYFFMNLRLPKSFIASNDSSHKKKVSEIIGGV